MPQNATVKFVMDLKSGLVYSLMLSPDGAKVTDFREHDHPIPDPGLRPGMPGANDAPPDIRGTTSFCVDVHGAKNGMVDLYTLVWPTQDQINAGKRVPDMAVTQMPADLIKAGLARLPQAAMTAEQSDEENIAQFKKAMGNINKLIGLDEVKKKLNKQATLMRFAKLREEVLDNVNVEKPSLHMVFTGNPGTGKTTVAREYGQILKSMGLLSKGHCVEVTRKDLVGGYIGQSEGKSQEKIEEAKGGVLFIDEAYALVVDGSDKDYGKQVIDQIVAEMENNRDDLVVIVAGYTEPMKKFINSNPGLKRRFVNYVNFPDFSKAELGEIVDFMAKKMDVSLTPDAKALALKKVEEEKQKAGKAFGNAGTIRNLIELAFENAAYRVMEGNTMSDLRKLDDATLEEMVTQITVDDIAAVNLQGIGDPSTGKIGFNTDDIQPAKPVKAVVGSAGTDFAAAQAPKPAVNDDRKPISSKPKAVVKKM